MISSKRIGLEIDIQISIGTYVPKRIICFQKIKTSTQHTNIYFKTIVTKISIVVANYDMIVNQ
jgi:hypothetical protein